MVINWLYQNAIELAGNFMIGLTNLVGTSINNIFFDIVELNNESPYVSNAMTFTMLFSTTLLGFMAAKQVLDVYILEVNGDSDESPLNLLVRVSQALAVAMSSSWIFDTLLSFCKKFSKDLITSSETVDVSVSLNTSIVNASSDITLASGGIIVFMALLFVGYIVFTLVAAIRGGEVILMKILCPIFAVDLVTTSREKWNAFFSGYLSAFLFYSVQVFCFTMSLKYISFTTSGNIDNIVRCGAWLILAIKSPKILEKYAHTSGVSRAASSGMRLAAQMLIMRR